MILSRYFGSMKLENLDWTGLDIRGFFFVFWKIGLWEFAPYTFVYSMAERGGGGGVYFGLYLMGKIEKWCAKDLDVGKKIFGYLFPLSELLECC